MEQVDTLVTYIKQQHYLKDQIKYTKKAIRYFQEKLEMAKMEDNELLIPEHGGYSTRDIVFDSFEKIIKKLKKNIKKMKQNIDLLNAAEL